MAFPAAGLAASTTDYSTQIGSELSVVSPATTGLSGLTHVSPATGSTVVDVTSTAAAWTLTATDAAVTSKGYMRNVSNALSNPLQIAATGGTSGDLTASGVSVGGAGVESKTFTFSQSLGASENVVAGNDYGLTVTYTATDNGV